MRIGLLGPVVAFDDHDQAIAVGGPKQRAVLALLALQPRSVVSADALADGVWGDRLPSHPRRTLSVYASTLGRALTSEVDRMSNVRRLQSVAPGYRLDVADSDVDVSRFRARITRATDALRDGRPLHARETAGEALAEWRGQPLHDLIDLPLWGAAADGLETERLDAEELCIQADLDLGRHHDVVADLTRRVTATPLRERLWGQLMLALYRDGRQADALAAFSRARRILRAEAGLDPDPDLVDLERRILAHDDTLRVRPPRQQISVLPVPLTSLVGREAILASVLDLLRTRRLVTLVGPGGVGKTRLAHAIGQHLGKQGGRAPEDIRTNAVTYVDCASVRTEEALAARIDDVVGGEALGDTHPVGANEPRARRFLLLDNMENMVEIARVLLPTVLQRVPELTVLCTSQLRLGCPGERVFEVSPLATGLPDETSRVRGSGDGRADDPRNGVPSPAARLYLERAMETYPEMVVSPDELGDVEALCRAVAGLPLAIELVAAQARTLSPGQALTRIAALMGPGASPSRPAASLRASVQHSLELVSPPARTVFAQLAVFAGGFTLEAAEAVCAPYPEPGPRDSLGAREPVDTPDALVPRLVELVDASLLQVDEGPVGRRFHVLEPLRLSVTRAVPAAPPSVHADFYAALGERVSWDRLDAPSDGSYAHAELQADAANWAKALEWTAAHDPPTAVRLLAGWRLWWAATPTAVSSAMATLDRLLTEPVDGLLPADVARANVLRGTAHYLHGDLAEAVSVLQAWLPRLTASRGDDLHLMGHCWLAAALSSQGRSKEAEEAAATALVLAEQSRDPRSLAGALDLASYVALGSGRAAEAEALARRSVALLEPLADVVGRCFSLDRLAAALFELERCDDLRACSEEMLRLVREGGLAEWLRRNALWNLANAHLLAGNAPAAALLVADTLPKWAESDTWVELIEESWLAAAVLVEGGDNEGAAALVAAIEGMASDTRSVVPVSETPTPVKVRIERIPTRETSSSMGPQAAHASALAQMAVGLLERLANAELGDATVVSGCGPRPPRLGP